jgi:2,3-dihydroxybenzoate decarboxylase
MPNQVPYKRIATEEAFATQEQFRLYKKLLDGGYSDPGFLSLWGFYLLSEAERPREVRTRLLDLDAMRISAMDQSGIDIQILSLTAAGVNPLPADEARALSISANDEVAAAIARHPGRYAALAAFAPQDPAHAAKEIERAVTKLGLKGAIFNGHTNGEWLDDQKFWVIFEACEALDVPIYLHPTGMHRDLAKPFVERGLDGAVFGFGVDTGLHALRLIVAGLFDRFPKLKFFIGHLGEALPFWLYRLDYMHAASVRAKRYPTLKPLKKQISDYMRENIYVTTSGMPATPAIRYCQEVLGVDHVLYAMDYPYQFVPAEVTMQDNLEIPAGAKKKFFQTNAESLFKLG